MTNSLNWFEIPASDFERAKAFYAQVLDAPLFDSPDPSMKYAFLPSDQQKGGVGGAIACGENYVPAMTGTLVYLNGGSDLSVPLNRVEDAGGKIILPKTEIGGDMGFMALFIDTEGNKVGFHSMG
jgi:predicted enzyme related to lactoylglutathione lyase